MRHSSTYLSAAALGFATGLRSMTPAAVVAQQVRRGELRARPFRFLRSNKASAAFAVLAAGEYVADKLPFVPARTEVPSLVTRMAMGAFCGAVVGASRRESVAATAGVGALAALAGSFAGYAVRRQLTTRKGLSDFPVAVVEDAVALVTAVAGATAA